MKKTDSYIRSTKVSLKFLNKGKANILNVVSQEYTKLINIFIEILWSKGLEKVPTKLGKEYTDLVKDKTWLSARMIQCAGKQASGIVRGNFSKQKKRLYMLNKLKGEGKSTEKLQKAIDSFLVSMPHFDRLPMELDNRFFSIDISNETSYDGWVVLGSIGNKIKIQIPFKKTKHFNKLQEKGMMMNSIRISDKDISLSFSIPCPKEKTGKTIGVDIGLIDLIKTSDGGSSKKLNGHDMQSIAQILSRKKKGSKAFARATTLREQYINYSIKNISISNVGTIRRENIKNMRKGKRYSRKLSHFIYAYIFGRLDNYCIENGVRIEKVDPTYTSQRCSKCGYTKKSNRKGKLYICSHCGNEMDADYNASINIGLSLVPISPELKRSQANRRGFFWPEIGQEPIVPDCNETLKLS